MLKLSFRQKGDANFNRDIASIRAEINLLDTKLLEILGKRFALCKEIGIYKRDHNISLFQLERWMQILDTRLPLATENGIQIDNAKH